MSMLQQRPFRFVLLFMIVFFSGDRLFSRRLGNAVISSEFRYSRLYRGAATADVLVLGDSRGVHSFFAPGIEQATGLSVVNLSFNGMPMRGSECLLLDYLERHPAPKLVVIEVTSLRASLDVIGDLRPYLKYSSRLRELYSSLFPASAYGLQVSHLYQYNCEMFYRIYYYIGRSDQSWIMTSRVKDDLLASSETQVTSIPLESPEWRQNAAALSRICATAQERKIKLRLVIAPYLPSYRRNIQNWTEVLQSLSESAPGFQIADYSLALSDISDFADRMHLNNRGAETFRSILERDDFFATKKDAPQLKLSK